MTCFGGVTTLIPSNAVVFAKIVFSMAVGAYLSPKHIVVAFANGTQKAGQPDKGEIEPAKALAVGGMTEFVLADLIAKDKCYPFAVHPRASP